MITSQYVLRKR